MCMEIEQSKEYRKWFKKLKDHSAKARIAIHFDACGHAGKLFGDIKSVGEGISEFRFHFGAGYRVYFAVKDSVLVLLLIGGDKGTQQNDIEKARQILNAYKKEQ